MAAITICSDFGAPQNKVWHCFHCFPIDFPWSDGTRCHIIIFICSTKVCNLLALKEISLKITFTFQFSHSSRVWLFATPWIAAHQASLSITNSHSLLKLMCIESVRPSNHLILCHSSPPAFNISQHQGFSQRVISLRQADKLLELKPQHPSFQWIFRTEFL